MSVVATIHLPQNESETDFYVPVCGEPTFCDIVDPLAEKLNLGLIQDWELISTINNENASEFFSQMEVLIAEISSQPGIFHVTRSNLLERLNVLVAEVKKMLMKREDMVVVIG